MMQATPFPCFAAKEKKVHQSRKDNDTLFLISFKRNTHQRLWL